MTKKKILFCGASGYGNIGDDSYRQLFSEYLSNDFELYFDSPYPNTNYIPEMDIVVIGGGGVIYCNQTAHFEYMKLYMDAAIKYKKPLCFLSCGVQLTGFKKEKFTNNEEIVYHGKLQLKPWESYFKVAKLLTVRSELDAKIIKSVCPEANVFYLPDLVHLIKPTPYHLIEKDAWVFIPTPSGHNLLDMQRYFLEAKQKKIRAYTVCFSAEDLRTVEIMGTELNSAGHFAYRVNLNPNEAAGILRDASKIITNRYHGAIVARAVGKTEDQIVVVDNRYKSVVEVPPKNLRDAYRTILFFKNCFLN